MIRVKRKLGKYIDDDNKENVITELTKELESYFESVGIQHGRIEIHDDTCEKIISVSATYKID